MHHKRRRPKHRRAGCLYCKPWKDERRGATLDRERWAAAKQRRIAAKKIAETQ